MLSNIRRGLRAVKDRVINQRRATLRRLKQLYRDGGLSEVFRGIRDYYTHHVSAQAYQDERIDNEERWEFIETNIDSDHETLVDLGCAEGFFVEKAGEKGLTVLGLEHNRNRVEETAERLRHLPNVTIEQRTLAPDTIDELESCDVMLFLTVHHHWVYQYGWEEAADMFRTICDRAEVVFYEPPGNKALRTEDDLDSRESISYYESVLSDELGESVTCIDSKMVGYKGDSRSDPVFVLDTSRFEHVNVSN